MTALPPLAQFLDPAALAIVLGGTLLATLLRTPWRDARRAVAALTVLVRKPFSADPLIEQIGHLSRIARRHGVLTLDRSVVTDPDLAEAIAAIVDGEGPEAVVARTILARAGRVERHLAVADIWAGAAEVAPAMGMVGTLIGLATMFATMNDPQRIGGAMAIALLATLYGALFANLIAQPIAMRLRRAARIEAFERTRMDAPLAALAAREAPRRSAGVTLGGGTGSGMNGGTPHKPGPSLASVA
ncbi:MotA/TolQ/ExbB proton channel family protein [Sphingomonadaceae bacterium jetA1]|jgi:chemotaxis protein MotA|uniref:motility protein A n=1 Tax=Facivitalis istanbulensis TaxID=3075838 RepID=UPI0034750DDF